MYVMERVETTVVAEQMCDDMRGLIVLSSGVVCVCVVVVEDIYSSRWGLDLWFPPVATETCARRV